MRRLTLLHKAAGAKTARQNSFRFQDGTPETEDVVELGRCAQGIQKWKHPGCNILIATDVAQRGLDIKDVAYVVNYAGHPDVASLSFRRDPLPSCYCPKHPFENSVCSLPAVEQPAENDRFHSSGMILISCVS